MGKSKANYAITGLSGKVGKIFVYRQRGGETIRRNTTHKNKFYHTAIYIKNIFLDKFFFT